MVSHHEKSLARKLLRWYLAERRDLPWRRTRDPYRIWVSEIMLQQTQVETAIPYYDRFVEVFPTVESLAATPLDRVLAEWSGLGYYRRARLMHKAARQIASDARGFPRSSKELLELPGIGPYTAAAVASIAFGEQVAVLDGNVERVVCRLLAEAGDPKSRDIRQRLTKKAEELLVEGSAGDGNQAMMELGALVCRPRRPDCDHCPLKSGCAAAAAGESDKYPAPRRRRKTEKVEMTVALVEREGRVLLFRRPEESELMAGMWELPSVSHTRSKGEREKALGQKYGGRWLLGQVEARIKHGITYRALTLHVCRAELVIAGDTVSEGPEAAWVERDQREAYAVSSMVDKILG